MKIAVIGCGVVGAAIAYELSLVDGLDITVFDENTPASGSTGAALGVLMGIISQKTKGRSWRLREASMRRYQTLIPELESLTSKSIPHNRDGILMLSFTTEDLPAWEKLVTTRAAQGWQLEIWQPSQIQAKCPHLNLENIIAALYSPDDLQVNPTVLTQALLAGARLNGVNFKFGEKIQNFTYSQLKDLNKRQCSRIFTSDAAVDIDWLIIAAGNGTTPLTTSLATKIDVRPVLGQALQLRLNYPIGKAFQPVITGHDVHIVPLGNQEYWLGATVEFPTNTGELKEDGELLEKVRQEAIAFCPSLADARIIRTWSGKRPRPENQSAPIIDFLADYSNVLLATGHYRNGVLLAPATAIAIKDIIIKSRSGGIFV